MRPIIDVVSKVSDGTSNFELITELRRGSDLHRICAISVCNENKNSVNAHIIIKRDDVDIILDTIKTTAQGLRYTIYPDILVWSDNRIAARFVTSDSGDKLHLTVFSEKVG